MHGHMSRRTVTCHVTTHGHMSRCTVTCHDARSHVTSRCTVTCHDARSHVTMHGHMNVNCSSTCFMFHQSTAQSVPTHQAQLSLKLRLVFQICANFQPVRPCWGRLYPTVLLSPAQHKQPYLLPLHARTHSSLVCSLLKENKRTCLVFKKCWVQKLSGGNSREIACTVLQPEQHRCLPVLLHVSAYNSAISSHTNCILLSAVN